MNFSTIRPDRTTITLFSTALLIRLAFLFFLVPIDPYWDSYHHWQISYYTLHIGLKYGRMWDLTGMEYYWGILPELVEAFLLWISNTASLLPYRLFNAVIGSLSICLIYAIVLKYFHNRTMGVISALLTSFWPSLLVFNTYGLTETLGIFFLLLSLLFYDKKEYFYGVTLGLASMCRIEYWPLTVGMIVCYLVFERSTTRFIPALAGWLTPMFPYLGYLQIQTGSAFYPLYWNFLGAVMGKWGVAPYELTSLTLAIRSIWLLVAVVAALVIFRLLHGKPSEYVVYVLFLGYLAFQGLIALFSFRGELFGARYLLDRFMMLDYIFLSILFSLLFVKLSNFLKLHMKKAHSKIKHSFQIIYGISLIALYLSAFISFMPAHTPQGEMQYFFEMSDWLAERYTGGTILCNIPMMNYRLINRGVPCQNTLGTIYAPHDDYTAAMNWLRQQNVTWFVMSYYSFEDSNRFYTFLKSVKETLPFKLEFAKGIIQIYSVNQTQIG